VKEHFGAFLRAEAPELLPLYRRLYPGSYAPDAVQSEIRLLVAELRERYALPERARRPAGAEASQGSAVKRESRQLTLEL